MTDEIKKGIKADAPKSKARTLVGKVVSNKMQKTLVVETSRYVKHPKYNKFMNIAKRYKVHNESGTYAIGDTVTILECRPISKDKNFTVVTEAKA